MYCPECSQQQVSDEVRFCPRCGCQLDAVQMLLAGSRAVTPLAESELQSRIAAARKRDLLLGATVMLVGAVAVALLTVSTVAGTPLQAVIIPLLLVWGAVVSVLLLSGHAAREVKRLFSGDASGAWPPSSSDLITRVGAAARRQALPPVQSAPASAPGRGRADQSDYAG